MEIHPKKHFCSILLLVCMQTQVSENGCSNEFTIYNMSGGIFTCGTNMEAEVFMGVKVWD